MFSFLQSLYRFVSRAAGYRVKRSLLLLRQAMLILTCVAGLHVTAGIWLDMPAAIALPIAPIPTEPATATSSPAALFEENCAGCHVNGGNVIRRGKNLKKRAMARNGYDSVAAIADIITHGKGIMSGYSDRLNTEEIEAIAGYVHIQSEAGW